MYKAAVIGLGFVGAGDPVSGEALGQKVVNLDGTHVQGLMAHPKVRLVAGSSREEGRRARFTERTGVRATYADWREMLAKEKPAIVGVATNSPYHGEITIACAEAGVRAIFCEKPVTTRLSDADRAIDACRRRGALLVINHNRRWHPLWRMVREEVAQGRLGQIQHAVAYWPTGRLGNVGTHMFDAVRLLLGSEPGAVSGTLDPVLFADCRGAQYKDPGGWGIVAFADGTKLFVDAAQAAKLPNHVRLVGSLGQVTLRRDDALVELWTGERRTLAAPAERPTSTALAVEEIVRCLDTGATPGSTGEDGRAALEIIIGFHLSDQRQGQWVQLPLKGKDRDLEVQIG